jgi:hypothetical protein
MLQIARKLGISGGLVGIIGGLGMVGYDVLTFFSYHDVNNFNSITLLVMLWAGLHLAGAYCAIRGAKER